MPTFQEIEQAKATLIEAGYSLNFLYHKRDILKSVENYHDYPRTLILDGELFEEIMENLAAEIDDHLLFDTIEDCIMSHQPYIMPDSSFDCDRGTYGDY